MDMDKYLTEGMSEHNIKAIKKYEKLNEDTVVSHELYIKIMKSLSKKRGD